MVTWYHPVLWMLTGTVLSAGTRGKVRLCSGRVDDYNKGRKTRGGMQKQHSNLHCNLDRSAWATSRLPGTAG